MPQTIPDWLPFISACVTVLFGLIFFLAPRMAMRAILIDTQPDHPEALAVARARIAGMYLGLGIMCLLLQQPLVYMVLAACWGLTAFGRMISVLSDQGNTWVNWMFFSIEVVLAILPALTVFGLVE
ncbi:MAG: DUF4345 family protein [Pseudomonadota bacterium]